MNLFLLHPNPWESVRHYNDKHVVKMITETAQLLSTAMYVLTDEQYGYKPTHKNHPSNVWVRESISNFKYTVILLEAIIVEHHIRWPKNRHKYQSAKNVLRTARSFDHFPSDIKIEFTELRLAINKDVEYSGVGFKAYQEFYSIAKRTYGKLNKNYKWSYREQPLWHSLMNVDLFPLEHDDFMPEWILNENIFFDPIETLQETLWLSLQ